ncbi:DUF1622 domain-containing protein [Actinacidiphila guanduensis]|uniref:Uncharacterized membrane protein n=1 Tax=Actinacidiphila guanduensis TaxID=310781 RepID=A0A1G9UYJ9_9ACTN|nr:DUF1622 domain-containing protein [Actinacidiphila guanduensis]SDM64889.1 Uncharacterized membrane protein [Actinacidiphila guanduensis]
MTFTQAMDRAAQVFEGVGAAVLAVGFLLALAVAAREWRRSGLAGEGYRALRETFGGALLLGLEILVAADLIRTVAVAPTLKNVAVLGLIVLIRTFLSFSLQIEIEGALPWRRASRDGRAGTGHTSEGNPTTSRRPPPGTGHASP